MKRSLDKMLDEFISEPSKELTEFFNILSKVSDGALLAKLLCQLDKESLIRACQVSKVFNQVCKKYQLVERRYDGHLFIYIGTRFELLAGEWDQFREEKVVSVACSPGELFCVFATESGRVFKFRDDRPLVIPNNEKAIRVYCNDADAMFITTAGNAYSFKHNWQNQIQISIASSEEPTLVRLSDSEEEAPFYVQGAMNNYTLVLLNNQGLVAVIRGLENQLLGRGFQSKSSKIINIDMNNSFLTTKSQDGYSAFYKLDKIDLEEMIFKNGEIFSVVQPNDLLVTTKDGLDYHVRKEQVGYDLSEDMIVGSDTKYMYKTRWNNEIRLTRKNQLFIDGKLFDFKMGISQVAIGYNMSVLIARLDPIMPLVCGQCGAENPFYFAGDNVYCGEECVKVSFKAAYGISNSVQGNQSCGGRCHIP